MNYKSYIKRTASSIETFFLDITFSENGYIEEVSELHNKISAYLSNGSVNHMAIAECYRKLKNIYSRGTRFNDNRKYYKTLAESYDRLFLFHRMSMRAGAAW